MRERLSRLERKEVAKKRKAAAVEQRETKKKEKALEFIESVVTTMDASSDILAVSETVRKSVLDLLVEIFKETGVFHEQLSILKRFTSKMKSHIEKNHILETQKNGTKIRLFGQLLNFISKYQDDFHEFIVDMASNALVMQSVVSQLREIGDEMGQTEKSGSTRQEGSLS